LFKLNKVDQAPYIGNGYRSNGRDGARLVRLRAKFETHVVDVRAEVVKVFVEQGAKVKMINPLLAGVHIAAEHQLYVAAAAQGAFFPALIGCMVEQRTSRDF
jgi:hypothetical protein